jgi:hypothetical protein
MALCIQHALRMRYIVIVACPAVQCFADCLETKDIEHKICVLIFSKTFVLNISHFKKN